ncbi:hypothetical protein TNCT_88131 [Trichonephila clavata]|uniref:Uncharacterized protein n=1 Tax=Trichonephila clavata TaxID=2740835 RepID=A0A8X6GMF8_TRICU|nr:hypothetical protein TNCT_88131 [Trichonephila clavata]
MQDKSPLSEKEGKKGKKVKSKIADYTKSTGSNLWRWVLRSGAWKMRKLGARVAWGKKSWEYENALRLEMGNFPYFAPKTMQEKQMFSQLRVLLKYSCRNDQ